MTTSLLLAALLAIACVLIVALPFIKEPEPEADSVTEPQGPQQRRLELLEARDRALAALRELEFDHRTGTISDEDYRVLVGPLRWEAAAALRALETHDSAPIAAGEEQGRPVRERIS